MTKTKLATGMALALIALPALAEDPGFYAGVGFGEVTLEEEIGGTEFKGTEAGFKLFGGYRFNEYGSLELAYLDANEVRDTQQGLTVASDAYAFQASAILAVPISARFEGFVRGSFFAWEAENTADEIGFHFSERTEGTDWGWGIGAAFYPAPRFGLRAELERANVGSIDMELLSVSSVLRF